MNNLAHLTKDIAHDISDSEAFRSIKDRVETLRGRQWSRYIWPTVGVVSAAVVVGYGIRAFLRTEQGQSFYREMSDRLSNLGTRASDAIRQNSSSSTSSLSDSTMSSV